MTEIEQLKVEVETLKAKLDTVTKALVLLSDASGLSLDAHLSFYDLAQPPKGSDLPTVMYAKHERLQLLNSLIATLVDDGEAHGDS